MTDPTSQLMSEIISQIGGLGRYQIMIFFLALAARLPLGINALSPVFTGFEVPHRCFVPTCETSEATSYLQPFLNYTTPTSGRTTWSQCKIFSLDSSLPSPIPCEENSFDKSIVQKCFSWIYDTSEFWSTTVTEFNLVCKKADLQPLAIFIFMLSRGVFAPVSGFIADKYGRRKAFLIGTILSFIGGLTCGLAHVYELYLFGRVVLGISDSFVSVISYVIAVELMPTKWRSIAAYLVFIGQSMGALTVAVMSYFIRQWRYLLLTLALNSVYLLFFYFIISESIMWLVTHGQVHRAQELTKKICKINKILPKENCNKITFIPNPTCQTASVDETAEIENNRCEMEQNKDSRTSEEHVDPLPLRPIFTNFVLIKRILIVFYGQMVNGVIYYGLSTNSPNVGSNIFISYSLIVAIELPSHFLAVILSQVIGRKGLSFTCYLAVGLFSLCSIFFEDYSNVLLALSILGKLFITMSSTTLYLQTAELFPTPVRGVASGIINASSSIGAMLAPFISNSGKYYFILPFIIFGVTSSIAAFLSLFLPETYGFDLPQTLEDCLFMERDKFVFYFYCFKKKNKVATITPGPNIEETSNKEKY